MDDFHHAPPSYEIFFRQYKNYTYWYLLKFGFCPNDIDDVVMELITRFMERDSIGVFSNGWESQSKTGQSVFRTYYTHFLLAYAPGKKRNLARVSQSEILLCDKPIGERGQDSWIDVHGPTVEFTQALTDEESFQDLVSRLKDGIDESLYDALFAVLDLMMAGGRVGGVAVARSLGCSEHEGRRLFRQVMDAIASSRYEPCTA
jgi:hypothetical protein